jgi:hypothetical protein
MVACVPIWMRLPTVTAHGCSVDEVDDWHLNVHNQAAGSRQQAAGSGQRAAGSRQQAAGSRQQAAGSGQRAAGSRQQAAGSSMNQQNDKAAATRTLSRVHVYIIILQLNAFCTVRTQMSITEEMFTESADGFSAVIMTLYSGSASWIAAACAAQTG